MKKLFTNFYNKNNVVTKWASISSYEKIGGWNSFLDNQDYVFACSPEKEPSYNHDSLTIVDDGVLVGYCIGRDKTLTAKTNYANAFDKEYVIFDFAVDCGEKSEELAKILLQQYLEYASFKGCACLSVQFLKEKYHTFYNLFKSFNATFFNDKLVIKLPCVELSEQEKLLVPTAFDALPREYMQFLYDKNFNVDQNRFWFDFNGETKISVDRKSAQVTFCNDIVLCDGNRFLLDCNKNLSIISFVLNFYTHSFSKIKDTVYINKTFFARDNTPYVLNVVHDNEAMLFLDKVDYQTVNAYVRDIKKVWCFNKNGVSFLNFYNAFYNWEINFCDCEHINKCLNTVVKNYLIYGDNPPDKLVERKKVLDKVFDFNSQLNDLAFFKFQMGNCFGGVKKLHFEFTDSGVNVKDNSMVKKIKNGFISDKNQTEDLIKKIKRLNFVSWNSRYVGNSTLDPQPWGVTIQLKNNTSFEYSGVNDYPQNWIFLLDLIDDYSFILQEEDDY